MATKPLLSSRAPAVGPARIGSCRGEDWRFAVLPQPPVQRLCLQVLRVVVGRRGPAARQHHPRILRRGHRRVHAKDAGRQQRRPQPTQPALYPAARPHPDTPSSAKPRCARSRNHTVGAPAPPTSRSRHVPPVRCRAPHASAPIPGPSSGRTFREKTESRGLDHRPSLTTYPALPSRHRRATGPFPSDYGPVGTLTAPLHPIRCKWVYGVRQTNRAGRVGVGDRPSSFSGSPGQRSCHAACRRGWSCAQVSGPKDRVRRTSHPFGVLG
jgi:hypothetical protein